MADNTTLKLVMHHVRPLLQSVRQHLPTSKQGLRWRVFIIDQTRGMLSHSCCLAPMAYPLLSLGRKRLCIARQAIMRR